MDCGHGIATNGWGIRAVLPGNRGRSPAVSTTAAVLLLILTTGCATTDSFSERMDGFVGEPLEAAKLAIGDGYKEHVLDGGERRLDWIVYDPGTAPGYRPPDLTAAGFVGGTVLPGEASSSRRRDAGSCRFTLFADSSGTVYDWQAVGERCRSLAP